MSIDHITLTLYRKTFTDDDVYEGEINVDAEMETVDIEIDDELDGTTGCLQIAEAIVDWLIDEGLTADTTASWFYLAEGSRVTNYYTGTYEELTAHLPDDAPAGLLSIVRDVYARRERERSQRMLAYMNRLTEKGA